MKQYLIVNGDNEVAAIVLNATSKDNAMLEFNSALWAENPNVQLLHIQMRVDYKAIWDKTPQTEKTPTQ